MTLSDWKSLSITQVILHEFEQRQTLLKEQLALSAGIDPLQDRYSAGRIAGYDDILNIEMEGDDGN